MANAPVKKPASISASIPASTKKTAGAPIRKAVAAKALPTDDLPTDIFALIGKSENIEQAAVAMQAMSHPMRIKILCLLSSGELSVQDIVDAVGTTQSNISQHLAILKACGMIDGRKDGTKMFYAIEDARILKMITLTREIFCAI
jgi:DNA-binding transcriptional ArsR family regulator